MSDTLHIYSFDTGMSSTSGFKRNLPGHLDRNWATKSAKISHRSSTRSPAAAAGTYPFPPLLPKDAPSKDPKGGLALLSRDQVES